MSFHRAGDHDSGSSTNCTPGATRLSYDPAVMRQLRFPGRAARLAYVLLIAAAFGRINIRGQGPVLLPAAGQEGPEPLRFLAPFIVGDWDSDGAEDLFSTSPIDGVSTPGAPLVWTGVYRGSTLESAQSWFQTFAIFPEFLTLDAGDWNSDGIHEGLVLRDQAGLRADVVELRSGQILRTFGPLPGLCATLENPTDLQARISVNDLDQDGTRDLAYRTSCGPDQMRAFSGQTGAALATISLPAILSTSESHPQSILDRNGDGFRDWLILRAGPGTTIQLAVLSGATGAIISSVDVPGLSVNIHVPRLATSRADIDVDGSDDFLLAADSNTVPARRLLAISGQTLLPFWNQALPALTDRSGLLLLGDQTGDGRADVILTWAPDGEDPPAAPIVLELRDGNTGALWLSRPRGFHEMPSTRLISTQDRDGDARPDFFMIGAEGVELTSGSTLLALRRTLGKPRGDRLGSLVYEGDLDQDGTPDLFLSAPGALGRGSVSVLSGSSGGVLRQFVGPRPLETYGESVCLLSDLDGDSAPDVAGGAPGGHTAGAFRGGAVFVHSGAAGDLIREISGTTHYARLGSALDSIGDLDGDARTDILVSAPNTVEIQPVSYALTLRGPSGFFIVNPSTGQVIRQWYPNNWSWVGISVSSVPDADGDGLRDALVIGLPGTAGAPLSFGPALARIYASSSGLELSTGPPLFPFSGAPFLLVPDWSGDGTPEIVLSTVAQGPSASLAAITAYSTPGWTPLWTAAAPPGSTNPVSLMLMPDWSGDSLPDVLVRTSGLGVANEMVLDVTNGAGLTAGPHPAFPWSAPLDPSLTTQFVTDHDADGISDWLIADPQASAGGSETGTVTLFSSLGTPSGTTSTGTGSPGANQSTPRLAVLGFGPARPRPTFSLGIGGVATGASTFLVAGEGLGVAPWFFQGVPIYLASTQPLFPIDPPFVPSAAPGVVGYQPYPLPIPDSPLLMGATLHFQAAVLHPLSPNGLFSTTNALTIVIP